MTRAAVTGAILIMFVMAVVMAALALAGCSSGSAPAPARTVTVTASPAGSSPPPSAPVVAHQLGATNVVPVTPGLYASDEVTAVLDGHLADIATFATNALRDAWLAAAEDQGETIAANGDRYAAADLN